MCLSPGPTEGAESNGKGLNHPKPSLFRDRRKDHMGHVGRIFALRVIPILNPHTALLYLSCNGVYRAYIGCLEVCVRCVYGVYTCITGAHGIYTAYI